MKGICFKEPLFIATIKGIKTQTRRIINPQPDNIRSVSIKLMKSGVDYQLITPKGIPEPAISFLTCKNKYLKPRYKVGEVVYLKEPYVHFIEDGYKVHVYKYMNDEAELWEGGTGFSWINKLFMPEIDARYFIKITAVRAERLQDISDEDCIREGIIEERIWGNHTEWFTYCNGTYSFTTPREAYKELINSIHGKGTWEENPFVWVYDYELYKEEL